MMNAGNFTEMELETVFQSVNSHVIVLYGGTPREVACPGEKVMEMLEIQGVRIEAPEEAALELNYTRRLLDICFI